MVDKNNVNCKLEKFSNRIIGATLRFEIFLDTQTLVGALHTNFFITIS